MLSGAEAAVDDFPAPVEDFRVVRQTGHGNGGINVFARFHGLNALRGMKPGLGDDDKRIKILPRTDLIKGKTGAAGKQFLPDSLRLRPFFKFGRLRIAENDSVHQRMGAEKRRKRTPETPQSYKTQSDTHESISFFQFFIFLPLQTSANPGCLSLL